MAAKHLRLTTKVIIYAISHNKSQWPSRNHGSRRTRGQSHINMLSLRNNQLKLEILEKLPIILEEYMEYTYMNKAESEVVNM